MRWFKWALIAAVLMTVLFFLLFILELTRTPKLAAQKSEKEKIIIEAAQSKKKLEKIRRDIDELENAAQYVKGMVLTDEAAALSAIKTISSLAARNGLKDVEIYYSSKGDYAVVAPAGALASGVNLAKAFGLQKAKPILIGLKFEGSYSSLVRLIEDLYNMQAVLSLEQLSITRSEGIMPLQKMFILVAAYMY